jgi:hypothetical protein
VDDPPDAPDERDQTDEPDATGEPDETGERDGDAYAASDAVIDEALAAGDPDAAEGSRPVDRFRRTAVGSIAAAGLLGLRDALEGRPEKEEPAIVVDAPGKRHDPDDPIDVHIDLEHPERSRVVIRRTEPPPEAGARDD